jgi:hypothetical protein
MRVTDELRNTLTPHLTKKSDRVLAVGANPPTAVYALVAALVKPESIEASWVRVSIDRTGGKPWTDWTVFVVTPKALAEVRVGFEASEYDANEEKDLYRSHQKTTIVVRKARADLLSAVARAEFVPVNDSADDIGIDQPSLGLVPLPRMKLTFADGRELFILNEGLVNDSEIDESKTFHAAIRKHLPF